MDTPVCKICGLSNLWYLKNLEKGEDIKCKEGPHDFKVVS